MNRKDLAVDGEYVDDMGIVYLLHSTDPGWIVQDGKWVEDPTTDKRYMGPVKGWQEYRANPNLRAYAIGRMIDGKMEPTRKTKAVVPPRNLVGTPEKVAADWRAAHKQGRQQERLSKTITTALTNKGFKVIEVDADNKRVILDMESVVATLGA